MPYELRVLGPPEVLDPDGNPVPLSLGKPLALLTYVACHPTPVTRDELAEFLWPDADRQRSRHSVRQALFVLKNALGQDPFESHDPLTLIPGTLRTDLASFLEALASNRVGEARDLWRGPVLDHFVLAGVRQWNLWTEELRTDLEQRFCRALLQHAGSAVESGDPEEALAALNQAVEVAPSLARPHLARIDLLLNLLKLDIAQEALAEAHRSLGDQPDAMAGLEVFEERLNQLVQDQRSRATEDEHFPMEFVGRSRELAGLHALLKEALLSRTRVAVVTGPSGIGKTRLARELLAYVSQDETEVVAVRGTRGEMKLRWGAASDVVRQLLRLPGSAGVSSASDSLLRAMLPSMARGETSLQTVNGVSPAAILDAVHDLLESVTFEAPLTVFVDDFQWLDPESRTLFVGLARRCRELRVLFLFLGRSDLSSQHWEQVEEALVSEAGARRFLLEPLIEEEVGELLALGAAFENPEHATSIVRRVHRASAGNPLYVREILRDLHEKGILRRDEHGWVFHMPEIPEELGIPENLRTLLRERLQKLSEASATVAATLAREDRKLSSEALQKLTQLPEAVFTQALAELLHRGVIEWTKMGSLDFVHELLRDEANAQLRGSLPEAREATRPWTRRYGTLALAALLVLVFPLGILWGRGVLPWERQPPPGLFGGGTIIFQRQGGRPYQIRATADLPEEWRPSELDAPPPGGTNNIFRAPGGGFLWFGLVGYPEGPDMLQLFPDRPPVSLFPGPGDQTLLDVSPDGSRILFVSENLGRTPYSHSLFIGELGTGRAELIYEGSSKVSHATWSGDGDLVAFMASAALDTLAVHSVIGERVGAVVLGDIHGVTWCGRRLVVSSSFEGEGFLLGVDVPWMTVDTLGTLDPGGAVSCSPDGTAIVYLGVVDRRLVPLVRDLSTGRTHRLPLVDGQISLSSWIPDDQPRIPLRVEAEDDSIRIAWGGEQELLASVHYSDGSVSEEGIRWEALEPAIASVGPYTELTGNGVGTTRLLARWGYSLVDTVVVEVAEEGESPVILREEFLELDTTRWITVGTPPPETAMLEGETVLRLRGDEKYTDGIVYREPLFLSQGITVELEFRMALTGVVHQDIGICLFDSDPESLDRDHGFTEYQASACTRYPGDEAEKFDPTEASVEVVPGRIRMARVPEVLPSDGWVHMALQVRADGESTLVLDRRRVASSPVNLPIPPGRPWALVIQGDVIGTELFVRNLAIWPGERY